MLRLNDTSVLRRPLAVFLASVKKSEIETTFGTRKEIPVTADCIPNRRRKRRRARVVSSSEPVRSTWF